MAGKGLFTPGVFAVAALLLSLPAIAGYSYFRHDDVWRGDLWRLQFHRGDTWFGDFQWQGDKGRQGVGGHQDNNGGLTAGSGQGGKGSSTPVVRSAPGPVIGVGLPSLAAIGGIFWLRRRRAPKGA